MSHDNQRTKHQQEQDFVETILDGLMTYLFQHFEYGLQMDIWEVYFAYVSCLVLMYTTTMAQSVHMKLPSHGTKY